MEKKKERIKKELTTAMKQMISFAAAYDIDTVPDELPDTFVRFINCNLNTEQNMNSTLCSKSWNSKMRHSHLA